MKEWLKKHREKRRLKAIEKNPYRFEERRLLLKQMELDPMSEEYTKIQARIKELTQTNKVSRDNKRRLTPEKATIWAKILGGLGTIGAIVAVAKFEKDGLTATGEKRTILDSLCRAAGNFLHK